MSRLELAIDALRAAAALPAAEQDRLAAEVLEAVRVARHGSRAALLAWIDGDDRLAGQRDDLLRGVREFREGFEADDGDPAS